MWQRWPGRRQQWLAEGPARGAEAGSLPCCEKGSGHAPPLRHGQSHLLRHDRSGIFDSDMCSLIRDARPDAALEVNVPDTVKNVGIRTHLDAATRRIVGDDVPQRLQSITDGHLTKLMALVDTMHAAGIDETLVRHSVHELIESYESELVDVMTSLAQAPKR